MENFKDELDKLPTRSSFLPLLEMEAKSKNLKIFIFEKEDLEKHFTLKYPDIEAIVVSKNEDTALWNLKNFKHSYLVKADS